MCAIITEAPNREAIVVMMSRKSTKIERLKGIFAGFLAFLAIFVGIFQVSFGASIAYAEPQGNNAEQTAESNEQNGEQTNAINAFTNQNTTNTTDRVVLEDVCKKTMGSLGWYACSFTGKISEAVDWLYGRLEGILQIKPVEAKDGTPAYEIWKYCLSVTNIVFIIVLIMVIFSQITGWGINNYGIKKILPKLIVMAIMVNLSFLICTLLVDVSNIIGNGLRSVFANVQTATLGNMEVASEAQTGNMAVSMANFYTALAGGAALAVGAATIFFEPGVMWMLIPTALGAIVAVATGLVTIAMRQAVVMLLVMISPLAFVANIMPNTEHLFQKWKNLFQRMLVFYPMFSLLYGASSLAGFALIMSAKDGFGLLLGMAVQFFPLFFSWKMMKMSGTLLGDINAKMQGLLAKPLARNRAWADRRRQQTNMNALAVGVSPSSHLRRFMDDRRALREKYMQYLQTIRKNEAESYVNKKVSAGYDGTKTQSTSEYLKSNKYTRAAKEASISTIRAEMMKLDTEHVLNEYEKYFTSKEVREKIQRAEQAGDKRKVEQIRARDPEIQRNMRGAKAAVELGRAKMTKESDEESDFYYMVNQFLDASTNFDPKKANTPEGKANMEKYRHLILSSTGGLGETAQPRVLGKIIAQAAAVESNQRRDIGLVAAKFPPDKRNFRNFLFNYFIDDDGYATDKEGNRIESMRDELRVNHPERLVMWDKVDENGPYFDWYDINGKYVTRIYKKDKPAIKELLANFDAPINDPINNMLVIHAGIKEQPDSDIPVLRNMGLEGFRTSIGRALGSFKEKNAAFSPMVAEMVKKGYIKNYAQEYLAYLDSLNKATKPGAWNMQDGDAIDMYAMIMDPDNWEKVFPTDLIRESVNVNGEPIYGVRIDDDGNRVKIPAADATRDELMTRIKEKFIIPAAHKIVVMMSQQTPNTMDNQKAGTAEKWKKLKEVFDTKWGEGSAIDDDPYRQNGDMRQITSDIKESLYTVDENGNRQRFAGRKRRRQPEWEAESERRRVGRVNHEARLFEIYNSSLDADEFATAASEYCAGFKETAWVSDQIQDFIVEAGYGVTKEQIYEKIQELLVYIDYD